MHVDEPHFRGSASGKEAVDALSNLIREREKTKRLLIAVALVLFVVAALVVVFAPEGREGLAYILGGALLVIALGAIGASQFKFRVPGVVVETNVPLTPADEGSAMMRSQTSRGHKDA